MKSTIENLAETAGARAIEDQFGRINFAVVAPLGSALYNTVLAEDPRFIFPTVNDAITALPKGAAALNSQVLNTIYVSGRQTITTAAGRIIIPTELSGLRMYCDKSSSFEPTVTLGTLNNAVLTIEGRDVAIVGFPKIETALSTFDGTALNIGGRLSTQGDGARAYVDNLLINGSSTSTDFVRGIALRGALDAKITNATVYCGAGTTSGGIAVIQATDGAAFTRNGDRPQLINCRVIVNGDATNGVIPLHVADGTTPNGVVSGGSYVTDGTGKAAVITSANWTLDGGVLFGSRGALASGGVVDLVTATAINIGEAYYKKTDGSTAAALIDQANL